MKQNYYRDAIVVGLVIIGVLVLLLLTGCATMKKANDVVFHPPYMEGRDAAMQVLYWLGPGHCPPCRLAADGTYYCVRAIRGDDDLTTWALEGESDDSIPDEVPEVRAGSRLE